MRFQVFYSPKLIEVEADDREAAIRQANSELAREAQRDKLRPLVYEEYDRPRKLEVVCQYAVT